MSGADGSEVLVTLDVFSGRPNPSWALSTVEAEQLERRLEGLPRRHQPPPPGGLGYRGFTIARSQSLPEVAVANGVVTIRGQPDSHFDDVHGVEGWLREQARAKGHGPLVEGD
jgi:hypothetical protein